jgi:hypothetical protein
MMPAFRVLAVCAVGFVLMSETGQGAEPQAIVCPATITPQGPI